MKEFTVSNIDLYTWATPNGRKVSVMLEELGLPYDVHPIHIGKDEQFSPSFLAISPNNKIPAIVDPDGPGGEPLSLFESGAILVYLAEKTGSDLLPAAGAERARVFQWLMFQMGGVGPMFGQAHHFLFQPKEDVPYGKQRYHAETKRLYVVMNKELGQREYMADAYSIADIATYPWVARYERHQVDLAEFPNVKRWFDALSARPAVEKGMAVPFAN
ncbi:MAG: glutathione S-transferase family protein [Gammaproteobacteria bacterium]